MTRCGGDCFFFSSRRRHTSFTSDWSSDVCSSDLIALELHPDHTLLSSATLQVTAPPTIESPDNKVNLKYRIKVEKYNEPLDDSKFQLHHRDTPGYGSRSEERRVGKECRSRRAPDH